MFGLAACDEGGAGFVNVSVRTITNARRVGLRLQSKCGSMHRHAQINADNTFEKGERTGSWVRQVAQAMEEQLKRGPAGAGDTGTSEEGGRCEEDIQDCA